MSCLCQKLKISLWVNVIGLASQVDGHLLRKLPPHSWDVFPASLNPSGTIQWGQKCLTGEKSGEWSNGHKNEKAMNQQVTAGIKSLTICPASLLFYSSSFHMMPSDVHQPYLILHWFGKGKFLEEVLKMTRGSLKRLVNSSSCMLKHQFCFKQPAFWGTLHFTVPGRDVCGGYNLKTMCRNGSSWPISPPQHADNFAVTQRRGVSLPPVRYVSWKDCWYRRR